MKYEVTDKCEQARKTLTMPNLLIGSNEAETCQSQISTIFWRVWGWCSLFQ